MFFKKEREDIEEIKEAVKPEEIFPIKPIAEAPKEEKSAPLFVKVDKYKEVLRDVQEQKVFISGMKQLFSILNEIENIRNDALKIMRATVQRLERNVTEIDTELLRPRGLELPTHGEEDIHNIEDSLGDLQKQLSALRRQLQELK
jgi:chromosome condensin MukBEF ATPase and DNA-binding subunit MukB